MLTTAMLISVQPAAKEDGWNTEPFVLTKSEDGSKLFGRGATDDKGPVLGWLHAIEAYQKSGVALVSHHQSFFTPNTTFASLRQGSMLARQDPRS